MAAADIKAAARTTAADMNAAAVKFCVTWGKIAAAIENGVLMEAATEIAAVKKAADKAAKAAEAVEVAKAAKAAEAVEAAELAEAEEKVAALSSRNDSLAARAAARAAIEAVTARASSLKAVAAEMQAAARESEEARICVISSVDSSLKYFGIRSLFPVRSV